MTLSNKTEHHELYYTSEDSILMLCWALLCWVSSWEVSFWWVSCRSKVSHKNMSQTLWQAAESQAVVLADCLAGVWEDRQTGRLTDSSGWQFDRRMKTGRQTDRHDCCKTDCHKDRQISQINMWQRHWLYLPWVFVCDVLLSVKNAQEAKASKATVAVTYVFAMSVN